MTPCIPACLHAITGLLNHEAQDVATFCEWGVDYIKLDSRGSTRDGWQRVRDAINKCDRPMYLQVSFCKTVAECIGWMDTIANSARTSGDAQANWDSVLGNLDTVADLWPLAGPTGPIGGHWNDPDLLEVGEAGGLTEYEMRSQIAMWSFVNAPLLLSCDLRNLLLPGNAAIVAYLTNPGIVALNQDKLGYQGRRVYSKRTVIPSSFPSSSSSASASASASSAAAASSSASSSSSSMPTSRFAPFTPPRGVVVAPCVVGDEQQHWQFSVNSTLVHVATGLGLTIPGCASRSASGNGVLLNIAPLSVNDQSGCSGKNQQWRVEANGTITSQMDGSCIDVFKHVNPVQSHFCVADPKKGGVPMSESWKVTSVAALQHHQHDSVQVVTVNWDGADGFSRCLQPSSPDPTPPPPPLPSKDTEVWQKQLANGDVALLLLNKGGDIGTYVNITAAFADIPGLNTSSAQPVSVLAKDVWESGDPGVVEHGMLTRAVPAHGVAVLQLSKIAPL